MSNHYSQQQFNQAIAGSCPNEQQVPTEMLRNAYVTYVLTDPSNNQRVILSCRMLNAKEFCSACARGEGCGAVFFNQLTEIGKSKDHVDIYVDKSIAQADHIQDTDIITIATSKFNYWISLCLFYLCPLVLTIFIPIVWLSLLQVNQLVIVASIFLLTTIYYIAIYYLMKNKNFDIRYIKIEQKGNSVIDSSFTNSSSNIKEL